MSIGALHFQSYLEAADKARCAALLTSTRAWLPHGGGGAGPAAEPPLRWADHKRCCTNGCLALGRPPWYITEMPKPLTADDILPLVACLTPQERVRLLRLISPPAGADAAIYQAVPPTLDEFVTDDEELSWDAEGWEQFG